LADRCIFFRVVQGLSAAPAQVTGMVILYEAFPPGQRGLVLGLFLLAGSLGPTIGPTLGGYLVQEYSWRAMFYLSLPTAVLSLIVTPMVLPKRAKPPRPAIDAWGLLSMAIWVVALLLAVSQGQRHGWDATSIRSLFAIAGVFLGVSHLLHMTFVLGLCGSLCHPCFVKPAPSCESACRPSYRTLVLFLADM